MYNGSNTKLNELVEYIEKNCYKISESYIPRLKYLDAVDKAYFKE